MLSMNATDITVYIPDVIRPNPVIFLLIIPTR